MSTKDDDDYIGSARPLSKRIPDGEYLAIFRKKDIGNVELRKRGFLHFEIVSPGKYHGVNLFFPFSFPENGGDVFSSKSKLVAAARVALKGEDPARKEGSRIAVKWFRHKKLLVKTRTVRTKIVNGKRKPTPEAEWYSVIDCLLAVVEEHDPTTGAITKLVDYDPKTGILKKKDKE